MWQYSEDDDPNRDGGATFIAQLDRDGKPVVLVSRRSDQNGWLRVYRPATH